MTHYVLTFRAQPGRTPTAEQEASWPAWFSQIGTSIADMGNRVGQARSVGYQGERDDVLSGYIVVTAADFDRYFDRQMARLVEPGRHRPLAFMMLVDDLAVIPDRAGTLLAGKLQGTDGEVRCAAADVVLELGGGLHAVLPLLDDTEVWVRWHVTGSLARYGDDSVVEPLIAKLRSDPDPAVRGQAAYALGHIGSPEAIPHLLDALDHDREYDSQGHSPSSISATALDNILGTNQTRILHDGGFCSLAPWPPDYDALRTQAWELYRKWKAHPNAI